jgi:hypothetical protein
MTGASDLPSPEEQPRVTPRTRVLGWIFWFGVPLTVGAAAAWLVQWGWSPWVFVILSPFIIGMPAVGALGLRYGANLSDWNADGMRLEFFRRTETVPWSEVEWFRKLWITQKLEGGGKAWVATLVKYRRGRGSAKTLLTVSGTASDDGALFPARYITVFDVRIPGKDRARALIAALVVVTAVVVSVPVASQGSLQRVHQALEELAQGRPDGVAALFRYFQEAVGADEAAKDQRIVKTFATLVIERLGRVESFEAATSTDPSFVNAFIESANADLWRNSECLFKAYAFRATLAKDGRRRAANVLLDVCVDGQVRPRWLRRLEVRLVRPDQETIDVMRGLFQALEQEIRRVRGPKA